MIRSGAPTFSSAGNEIMGYLSGQTNLPWNRHTWLGEGHTIPCDALSRARQDSAFTAVLLVRRPTGAPVIELPDFRGDPVSLLWAVPITEPERALAMDSGSAALLERLDRAGAGWMHRSERVSVA